ncbi:conserved hypothetical protein [metagenome]|uniref:Uncharacterized protein n=1 Tax=metagenome TaxID=256318 RepID=A0A2P2C4P0_9ZZZZ
MDLGGGLLELAGAMVLAAFVFSVIADWTVLERLSARFARLAGPLRRLRRTPPLPPGRPIELIALDVRRLSHRFETSEFRRLSFAKYEGIRRAYDDVLGEACDALGIQHLLGVLPAGHECDLERLRVENLLSQRGLRLTDDAA